MSVANLTDRLKEQVRAFGKCADEIEDYKLMMLGADDATRDLASSLRGQLRTMKDAKARQEAAAQAQKDLRADALGRVQDLISQGAGGGGRPAPGATAVSGRFLTGTPGGRGMGNVEKNTKLTVDRLREMIKKQSVSEDLLRAMLNVLDNSDILKDELVGLN